MKKSLSIVLVLTLVLSMFASVVSAAPELTAQEKFDALKAKGIFEGDGTGANLDGDMTREQLAKILALLAGLSIEAEGQVAATGFSDVAVDRWSARYINAAKKANLMEGTSDTTFDPNGKVTVEQLATVFARALKLDVTSTTVSGTVSGWAKGFVTAAIQAGLITASSDYTTAAKRSALVAAAYSTYQALLTVDSVAAVADVTVTVGDKPVLPATVKVTYNDKSTGDVAVTWSAVDTSKAGTVTATGTIAGTKKTASVNVVVTEKVLAVESVTALNAKQIQVVFNKDLDATAAATAANYLVYDMGTTSIQVSSAALQADKRTVILSLATSGYAAIDALTNLTNAKVVVKVGVKDAAGVALAVEYSNAGVTFADSARPTITGITQLSPSSIKVLFNEPIKDLSGSTTIGLDNVSIDDGTYTISSISTLDSSTQKDITVVIAGTFTAGNHTVKVNPVLASDLVDYAGFEVAQASSASFTNAANTSAIVATLSATQAVATIKFDRIVNNAIQANVLYRHTVNGTQYQLAGDDPNVSTLDSNGVTVVTLNFSAANKPLPTGSGNVYIAYATSTGTKITDGYNNIFTPALAYPYSDVSADVTAPSVSAAVVSGSKRDISITFSEKVGASVGTASNFVLTQGTTTIATTGAPIQVGTTNVYTLSASADMSGVYNLTIKNIVDTAVIPNSMPETTLSINVPDLIAPGVVNEAGSAENIYFTQGVNTKIRVYFSEVMNSTDLATLTNYQNASDANKNPTSATPAADGKSVYLVFANEVNGSSLNLNASMKDLAGNKLGSAYSLTLSPAIGAKVTLQSPTTTPVKATSQNTITVALNDVVTGFTASDFEIDVDGSNNVSYAPPVAVTADSSSGKTILTFTLGTTIAKNAWDDTSTTPRIRTVSAANTAGATRNAKNQFGVPVEILETKVADVIAPELATASNITTMDANGNGRIDHIKITFNEKVNFSSININQFVVTGFTVTDAYASTSAPSTIGLNQDRIGATIADSSDVYLTVSEITTGTNTNATPTVTIANTVKDVAGNAYAGLSTLTASVDKAGPVASVAASTGSTNNATTLVITYSEALYISGTAVANGADIKSSYTPTASAVTITSAIYDSTAKTVTFKLASAANNNTLTVAATVTDAAGNAVSISSDVATYTPTGTVWTLN